jgi:hypothetical protein
VTKIASIGLAVVTLAIAALPAHADSEAIGRLIGASGTPHWARSSQQQSPDTPRQSDSAFAYEDHAEGAALPGKICGHVGGPKTGTWSCR